MKNRLKEFRESCKMSQEELSEKTKVSRTTISKIENNENVTVKTSTLISIADALGKTVRDIFFIN
ncbi:helix-turn-helix transcriptional regulator [Helcococcus ovis]|uniref:helix-turn-helix transcriptional regulator n=1 Tax=Helcococcus TaxID=31983 RepID=UPI0038B72CD0